MTLRQTLVDALDGVSAGPDELDLPGEEGRETAPARHRRLLGAAV